MSVLRFSVVVFAIMSFGGSVLAGPKPGDVFREYRWRPEGNWQRVTGPETTEPRAQRFLPNAVNEIAIDDLDKAVRAEVYLEMLLCHTGTIDKRVRVNGSAWLPIPESELIPGTAGIGPPGTEYQSMRYPEVAIPLDQLRGGKNTFELTCSGGTRLGRRWPQWILYGVTFRIYYSSDKPHATGRIVEPEAGAILRDDIVSVRFEAAEPRPVERVELVGLYTDFNWEGDGNDRQWHYRYLYGQMLNYVGTSPQGRKPVGWDTQWIPTQDQPISLAAWVVDESGVVWVSPAVDNLRLARRRTVRMLKPYEIPKGWATRAGQTDTAKIRIEDDLAEAVDARLVMSTWNGVAADEIG
ncbi:MAG: hypothetical protein ACYC6Y_16780, partial [Thermoguttaceae bacterium]